MHGKNGTKREKGDTIRREAKNSFKRLNNILIELGSQVHKFLHMRGT